MQQITHLRQLTPHYDAILLDQFGVIHNGRTPYPAALHAISQLHRAGLRTIILSNSSRQAHHAVSKLHAMGVEPAAITAVLTSGQLALGAVRQIMVSAPQTRVLHLTWKTRGSIDLAIHGVREVAPLNRVVSGVRLPAVEDVDMVLAHGTEGITVEGGEIQAVPLEVLKWLCRELGQRRPDLPFYCANPDVVTVDGAVLRTMPGALAREFEKGGGKGVVRLGKPAAVAYEEAIRLLGNVEKGRILAVGDSVAHDVLGAMDLGIDCLYIAGGINAEEFQIDGDDGFEEGECLWQWDELVFDALVKREAPELGLRRPKYISSFFRW